MMTEPQPEYHQGGFIEAGLSQAANVRQDEYIFTATQWDAIRRLFQGDDEE